MEEKVDWDKGYYKKTSFFSRKKKSMYKKKKLNIHKKFHY